MPTNYATLSKTFDKVQKNTSQVLHSLEILLRTYDPVADAEAIELVKKIHADATALYDINHGPKGVLKRVTAAWMAEGRPQK